MWAFTAWYMATLCHCSGPDAGFGIEQPVARVAKATPDPIGGRARPQNASLQAAGISSSMMPGLSFRPSSASRNEVFQLSSS